MRTARPAKIFDSEGHEVLITQRCTVCGKSRPLRDFGLRRMGDGKIRSIPQCKRCRSKPRQAGEAAP